MATFLPFMYKIGQKVGNRLVLRSNFYSAFFWLCGRTIGQLATVFLILCYRKTPFSECFSLIRWRIRLWWRAGSCSPTSSVSSVSVCRLVFITDFISVHSFGLPLSLIPAGSVTGSWYPAKNPVPATFLIIEENDISLNCRWRLFTSEYRY